MRPPDYTPSEIARTLRNPALDRDLALDLERALPHLTPEERTFISYWAQGYPATEALIRTRGAGNSGRWLGTTLRKLARLLNEGSEHE